MSYPSEKDILIFRFCLEILIRHRKQNIGIQQVPLVINQLKNDDVNIANQPLITLLYIIIDTINGKDFETYKKALGIYQKYLDRDNNLGEYLDRIAKYYFDGATIKQKNMMAAMM